MTTKVHALEFNSIPAWFEVINRTWMMTYPIGGRIRLDKDNLIRAARKNTGLQNLGADFWDEPLERLIRAINEEAALHPIGSFITKKRIINLLSTRLQAEWWFRKHPEILEDPLYPVMLISGLQRTGTTKLQRLLSADPDSRSLLSWEAINPAPPVRGPDRRVGFARTSEKALRLMAPGFFAIHPVEHQAEEEDILLLDVSFLSTTPEATMHVPSYASWLEKTDQSPAYGYAVKLLKLLQWQRPGKRWILKSPHHLEFYDLIDKHFGEVYYLWTHRDLSSCIPSFLSMVAHGQRLFSDQVQMNRITSHWTRKTRYMLDKAMTFRKNKGNDKRFIDIQYDTFIREPISTLRHVYAAAGIPMNQDLEAILRLADEKNHKGKYGSHVYALSDFGLDEEDIESQYRDYLEFMAKLRLT